MEINQQTLEFERSKLEEILNNDMDSSKEDFIVNTFLEMQGLHKCGDDEESKKYNEEERERVKQKFKDKTESIKDQEIYQYGRIVLSNTKEYFVAKGSHQAVINLGNGIVAKFGIDNNFSSEEYTSVGFNFPLLNETCNTLIECGFDIQERGFLRAYWKDKKIEVVSNVNHDTSRKMIGRENRAFKIYRKKDVYIRPKQISNLPNAFITLDLRENGLYNPVDFNEEIARSLSNGEELIKQYKESFDKLSIYALKGNEGHFKPKNGPYLTYHSHKNPSPEEAIRKMFLLQIPVDKKLPGKLVLGDLDHVYIFK